MERLPVVSFERLLGSRLPMVPSDHRQGANWRRRSFSAAAAEILQPLCYVGYLSSALAIASWKSLASVKISCL